MRTWLMKKGIVVAAFVILSLLAISVTVTASDRESMNKIRQIARYLSNQGWDYRGRATGDYLSQGRRYFFRTTLFRGNSYMIIAAGDSGVRDLDIQLYDENGNLIDDDDDNDSTPIVEVSPSWSGTFYVVVKMYRGSGYSNVAICYR